MTCQPGCGACCIAISISSPIPGMPDGKPAGVACANLDPETHLCRIWGTDEYPDVCRGLRPSHEMCGEDREHAIAYLQELERATAP